MSVAARGRTPVLRKWYFCINARGFAEYRGLMAAAVASARRNTDLVPHCIYDGDNPAHLADFERLGVRVVPHRSSFEDALQQGYGPAFGAFGGHWLRVDLPLIEREDPLILYSDVDVMFLRPPDMPKAPRYIGAGAEFDRANLAYFNSGVLVMNLPRLRRVQSDFVASIRHRLTGDFRYPAHDQESYNRFFGASLKNRLRRRQFTPMPEANNWKPFWGQAPSAAIVHFHGPKPANVRAFESGRLPDHQKWLIDLWQQAPQAYAAYSDLWDEYHAAGQDLLQTPLGPA